MLDPVVLVTVVVVVLVPVVVELVRGGGQQYSVLRSETMVPSLSRTTTLNDGRLSEAPNGIKRPSTV